MTKKVKNRELQETNEFSQILDFSLFCSFRSESGLGSHFAKRNCKGNVIVSKLDFLTIGQPARWLASALLPGCLAASLLEHSIVLYILIQPTLR